MSENITNYTNKANELQSQINGNYIDITNILGEIYEGDVKLVPVVLNPKGVKTPDYIINNKKFDLKEPEGDSPIMIYDLFNHKRKQADNLVIGIHKSKSNRIESLNRYKIISFKT